MKTDQYQKYAEENPKKHVGPQHYWQTHPYKNPYKKKKKSEDDLPDEKPDDEKSVVVDDEGKKKFYINRQRTDKVQYKPMKKHIF